MLIRILQSFLSSSGVYTALEGHRMKVKEDKKLDKYMRLDRELKKLWNIKVTVIPIVIRALETVLKNLEKRLDRLEIKGRIETLWTTALQKLATILSRLLRRLVVTQTPVKKHQIELMRKTPTRKIMASSNYF